MDSWTPIIDTRGIRLSIGTLLFFGWMSCGRAPVTETAARADDGTLQAGAGEEGIDEHAAMLFFENSVRPLLIERCIQCHGPDKQEGNLRLDTSQGLTAGGDSGPAIDPDALEQSLLLAAIRYDGFEMPPSGPLPPEEIAILEQWIAGGASWPDTSDSGLALRGRSGITDEDRDYWAFRPLQRVALPQVAGMDATASHPVDRFLRDRLHRVGLEYSAAADKRTLARRAYLDLVGVPPTPAELARFLGDDREDAFEQLIIGLQADRRYGEKWARFWLDLVRYAESDGFNQDADRPTAYLYRDWLIEALNADLPYDQFVLQQLAGDELDPHNPQLLAATGFLRHWIYEYNQRDARTQLSNILNDLTDVTGEVFFGLGVGCARCHDHKFDPLLQEDYYRLQAAFADFLPDDEHVFGTLEEVTQYRQQLATWESATAEIRDRMRELEAPVRKRIADAAYNKFPLDVRPMLFKPSSERDGFEQQIADLADRQVNLEWSKTDYATALKDESKQAWEALAAELKGFEHLRPAELPRIMAAGRVAGPPPATTVPGKGTADDAVSVRFVSFQVLGNQPLSIQQPSPGELEAAGDATGIPTRRRSALAAWINSPNNGLTHRVIVNRIWQELFGVGLVQNSNDFGRLGQPPTHPELLDWLAAWFIEDGRSFQRLQRLLMTSQAYRQSSRASEESLALAGEVDWENRLLWRFPARRMEAEQIRDSILAVCGCLEPQVDGPSQPHDSRVRSIYTQVKRNRPHPILSAFDVPDRSVSIGGRVATTTVNQSLVLGNSPWINALSNDMARLLRGEASEPAVHISVAFERTLGRLPNEGEQNAMFDFLRSTTLRLRGELATQLASGLHELQRIDVHDSSAQARAAQIEVAPAQDGKEDDSSLVVEPVAWHLTDEYLTALSDMCHVLLNSSEFLYID
jgi:mono/diheme cytochrome c family protein